jgi:hypothetical protein
MSQADLPPRRDLSVLLGVPALYLLLAVALTWPAATTFTTRIAGDYGDGFQNLWNFWWVKEALTHFKNPFFTDHLRHPFGVTLVFQTMTWPDALAVLPLWAILPPLGVYNAAVLFSFVLTGLGMYALVHDATGNRPASVFAGAAFMACPFHMSHALGHQHLVALGYLPLYLMFLHRIVRGGTRRDAALGGLALAAAALCSWYQLLFAFIWSLGVFGHALATHRATMLNRAFVQRAFTLAGCFLLVAGPLLLAMYLAARGEPIVGSHDARWFSADLESLFFPGGRMAWNSLSTRHFRWTGNDAENGDYLGYLLLALGAYGAIRSSLARAYGITGVLGALLSLGPALHEGGHLSHDGAMPYALLVRVIPGLDFSGVPVRFGLLAQGSLVVMAALGLAVLLEKKGSALRFGLPAVATLAVLVELWPVRLPTSVWPVPAPMEAWARSTEKFSVLDFSGDTRMLWNALHHGKPCVGGYITRAPKRLDDWWTAHPIFGHLDQQQARMEQRFERDDPALDFDWGQGSPDPRLNADHFAVRWDGSIEVPSAGDYTFFVSADDGAALAIDGRLIVQATGSHEAGWQSGKVHLEAGRHPLAVEFHENTGDAALHVEWEGPGLPRGPVRPAPLPNGVAAFHGRYGDVRVGLPVSREEGERLLRELGLRYVVLSSGDVGKASVFIDGAGMRPVWQGDGLTILELAGATFSKP